MRYLKRLHSTARRSVGKASVILLVVGSAALRAPAAAWAASPPIPLPSLPVSTATPAPTNDTGSGSGQAQSSGLGATSSQGNGCVSCTSASAGPQGGSASARPALISGPKTVSTGGSSPSSQSGSLFAVPANSVADVGIGNWSASTTSNPNSSSASSGSSLLDVTSNTDQIGSAEVLESDSTAHYQSSSSGSQSTASSNSNAVMTNVDSGTAVVYLLQSSNSSDGTKHLYLASINGNQIDSPEITVPLQGIGSVVLLNPDPAAGQVQATSPDDLPTQSQNAHEYS